MPFTEPETIKAAKQAHSCSWCAEPIKAGEPYMRYRWFAHGEASTVKMHPECYGAMLVEAANEGGEIEWCPGDYERPEIETAQPA